MSKGLQIALTGRMRSGKDTVGQYLVENYGFKRFAFGDGIVKTCKRLFPDEFIGGKPRELLQDFGQYCVSRDQNVWVNYLFREMLFQGIDPVVDNVVITDLRQPHEYEKLLESGFTIVRVNASEETRKLRMKLVGELVSDERINHETERHVDFFEVDYEIDNDSQDEQLIYPQIEAIIADMNGGEF